MIHAKTIFISPLDWGLGHASRCVPIIHDLKKDNKVIIGVTPSNDFFFESYFPELQKIQVPSYNISYSKNGPLWLKLAVQWPAIIKTIRKEHRILQQLIYDHKIDLVISDNRFGMYSKLVESIFITHQLKIKAPFFSAFVNRLNTHYIHQFNEVWVPDNEDRKRRLSGDLSDSEDISVPVKYIGPKSALSSFTKKTPERTIDYLIVLSGPEPQRTILENELVKVFKYVEKKIVLVRGIKNAEPINSKNVLVIDYSFGGELKDLIVNAQTVICRSGYSSLMDVWLLEKKKMILIPTPGQTEQEYLARHWQQNFGALVFDQKNLAEQFKIHLPLAL